MSDIIDAHRHSSRHRESLERSASCGCFHCLGIFTPDTITDWIDEDDTALCPTCGIDSVIGSSSGNPITRDFLKAMRAHWF